MLFGYTNLCESSGVVSLQVLKDDVKSKFNQVRYVPRVVGIASILERTVCYVEVCTAKVHPMMRMLFFTTKSSKIHKCILLDKTK